MIDIELRNIHYTQKNNNSKIEFEIKQIDDLFEYPECIGKLHKHDFYFILFLTRGSSQQIVDFERINLTHLKILFMYPGQVHAFKYAKGTQGFTLYFTDGFLNNPNSSVYKIHQLVFNHNQVISIDDENFEQLRAIFQQLYNESSTFLANKIEMLRAHMEVLMTTLLRKITPFDTHKHPQSTLLQLLELKEQFYRANIEMKAISTKIGLSQKKLNILSKEYFGKTFLQLLNDRKLLEVKRLLATSDYSIKEIAFHIGFTDSAHLNNFFKKRTGITPLQFKKANQ